MELDVLRQGSGRPILVVHGTNPVSPHGPFLGPLSQYGEIIAPSHPGFGATPMPPDFETMYDLVNLYQDVIDAIPHDDITMIGLG